MPIKLSEVQAKRASSLERENYTRSSSQASLNSASAKSGVPGSNSSRPLVPVSFADPVSVPHIVSKVSFVEGQPVLVLRSNGIWDAGWKIREVKPTEVRVVDKRNTKSFHLQDVSYYVVHDTPENRRMKVKPQEARRALLRSQFKGTPPRDDNVNLASSGVNFPMTSSTQRTGSFRGSARGLCVPVYLSDVQAEQSARDLFERQQSKDSVTSSVTSVSSTEQPPAAPVMDSGRFSAPLK